MRYLLIMTLLLFSGAAYALHQPDTIDFRVYREGSPMGSHQIKLTRDGDKVTADIVIDLTVQLGPFTLFAYKHRNTEVWQKGRLVSLQTTTDDNGDKYEVRGQATREGFRVEGPEGTFIAPKDIMTTSYWQARTVEQAVLLDTQHGKLVHVKVTSLGDQTLRWGPHKVMARHYQVRGDLDLDIWYDDKGNWAKLFFTARGSDIEYKPRHLH
jgi:hypothetical protein